MTIVAGIVWILIGLVLMAFGLWVFYGLLPLFYSLLGAGLGFWLGLAITGNPAGLLTWILAIVGAIVFAMLSYFLEPARRILVGVSLGSSFGLAIAYAFGAGTLISVILAAVGGVIFGIVLPTVFDTLVVVTTAINGAAMAMDGANMILDVDFLDRGNLFAEGHWVALVIWIVLAVVGLGWQYSNIEKWIKPELGRPI